MKSRETQAMIEDVNNIKRWHHDRNLIDGSDDKKQENSRTTSVKATTSKMISVI